MEDTKPFWTSKVLWGAIATFIGVLLPAFGIKVEPTDVSNLMSSFTQVLDSVLTFGGLALTIFGRLRGEPKKLTYTFRQQ